jgi:UbiA prenyltransferase family
MNRSGKLHALLSTARVANIPSVVSNVWAGMALGIVMNADATGQALAIPWMSVTCLTLSGIMLYVGGNFFNDWMDKSWDAEHRPERALPRELFSPAVYFGIALCANGTGTALAGTADLRSGLVAAGIVLMILIYTIWHKKTAWMVIPMGLCRAGLPVMGYLAIYPYLDAIWPLAAALFCYIIGLSLSARHESKQESPQSVAVVARGLFLTAVVMVALGNRFFYFDRLPSVLGALPFLAWTAICLRYRSRPLPRLVSGLLAGIPLVDWMALLPLGLTLANDTREGAGMIAAACFVIPPLAFISARLLQRLAPAT